MRHSRFYIILTLLALLVAGQSAWADDVIVKYLDPTAAIGAQRKSVTNPGQITAETTAIGSAGNTTWYYVSGTVTNNNRIEVSGTVNLILEDGCDFTVSKGIHVASDNALNIYAQSVANRGSLTADNYGNDAAIGGNGGEDYNGQASSGEPSGNITIYGGTITTSGNIGGGDGGDGSYEFGESNAPGYGGKGGNGNVTIYSGYVDVRGNIGGGNGGTGEDEYGGDDPNNYGSNGGGTINFSWTTASDVIHADNYYGNVTLQKEFYENNSIDGVTFMHAGESYTVIIGSMPEGVTATADLELNAGWKNAVEGQVVTICFSGVPAGKVPVLSATYYSTYWDSDQYIMDFIDNGDGTISFKMGDGYTTVTADAELKKDIKAFTASVPDQELSGYDHICYKFWDATAENKLIGETVKDDVTTLTLGTHYTFGSVYYSDMTGFNAPDKVGDKCLVEIKGIGDYAGTIYAPFTIIGSEISNQTWGDLTWSLSDGELSISLTNPANGNKPMPETNREGYPWYPYATYITTINIGEGVTSIAASAFAGTQNEISYGGVTSLTLPSTLTHIGDYAFAYCTGLDFNLSSVDLPANLTYGVNPFNQLRSITGTLRANADNTEKIRLMTGAQTANVIVNFGSLEDEQWNTLCLPFNVDDLAGVIGYGATVNIMELDTDGYSNGSKRLVFTNGKYYDGDQVYDGSLADFHQTGYSDGKYYVNFKEATSIEAGKPYLIYIDYADIEGLTFNGVHVTSLRTDAVSEDGKVRFVGNYVQGSLSTAGDAFVWDSSTGKFAVPTSNLDAFKAYIQLTDANLSDAVVSVSNPGTVNQFVLTGTIAPRNLSLTGQLHDGAYWSTFYNGSDRIVLPAGAAAYTLNSSKKLYRLGNDGRTVPKNTAVVIIADRETISLSYDIGTSDIAIHGDANLLQGSDSPVTVSGLGGPPYVLGIVGGVLRFYEFTGASIPAHKAYYVE